MMDLVAVSTVFLLASASAQIIPLSTSFATPTTVGLQAGFRTNSTSLDLNDPTLPGADAGPNDPTEVHLAPNGLNSIYVLWATGNYTVGHGALQALDTSKTASIVKYGTSASSLSQTAQGTVEIYNQIYNTSGGSPAKGGVSALNYTSPYLHTTVLSNLTPGTQYFYQVGDGTTFSAVYNFTSLLAPGPQYPQRVITLADWGASHNSTVTRDHAVASAYASGVGAAPVVHYIGDFTYADTWYANGTASLPTSGFEGIGSSTFQPVWDLWQRMIEPLVSHVPMLTCTGNHEIEQQDDANNTIFASVQARWKVPKSSSNSSYFFYSQEYGPVHAIFLTVYVDYTPGSDQWNFLSADLLSVNRTATPWIIVNFHNPWYTTDTSYKEFEQFRVSAEPLLTSAGVDVVYYGHVHAYERSYPVNNYMLDPCGTTHITIGDAGNTEGLSFLAGGGSSSFKLEDIGGGCPNVSQGDRVSYMQSVNPLNDPWKYYKRAFTFQANGNTTGVGNPAGYCYSSQPMWSAYREPSFGHGTLDVLNATHALWSWHRNQDNNAVPTDQAYIVRDTSKCLNKMYPQMRSTNGAMLTATS